MIARLTAEVERLAAERDEARGLLRDVIYGGRAAADVCGPLRDRIAAHLGRTE